METETISPEFAPQEELNVSDLFPATMHAS
jgi:hypothetical protein